MPRLSTSLRQKKKGGVEKTKARKPTSAQLQKQLKQLQVADGLKLLCEWFHSIGYHPFPYQQEAWTAYRSGNSGLIHVPTGAGKTYAAYLGPLSELIENPAEGLQILIITPLRALSRDMEKALEAPIQTLKLPFRVETRTGDTSSATRTRQRKQLPQILITTPESLNLLISYEDAKERFSQLKAVIVDEWHELMTSKRGIQTELALARLRHFNPTLRTWALSATIANLEEAARCALGTTVEKPIIITSQLPRPILIETLLPEKVEGFPWAGHLGGVMLKQLLEVLDIAHSTLIFTNVRSHAELWYQNILEARPEWAGLMALHHGSLDKATREFVEEGVKVGAIKLVICTSSLDLGVDFSPVERIYQIGSPKGVARIMQRAGRAAHRPGETCKITCVPTQLLELIEITAVRTAIQEHHIEPRISLKKPYDVLIQHMVTCALGGGFSEEEFYQEVVKTHAYQELTREEFKWIVFLVQNGGNTLNAYPEYRKIELQNGIYKVLDKKVAQLHRFNIGTISSDTSMQIAFLKGKALGQVEESFVSRLQKGDVFTFAGRMVEFVMIRDMTAYVRLAHKKSNVVPRWSGGRLPLSLSLASYFRTILQQNHQKLSADREIQALTPILKMQKERSFIPKANELLIETLKSRAGYHLFIYPFEGRLVHEGLAALLAYRMSQHAKLTFQMTVNDYGIEFLSQDEFPFQNLIESQNLFSGENVAQNLIHSLNMTELARRQFREISRIAGLIYQHYPGIYKNARQLQTSASILYDVFLRFEPDNLLLQQAQREVLENQFEQQRLTGTLKRMRASKIIWSALKKATPLCFPLMAERIGSQQLRASNESTTERILKMQQQWLQ